jgi:cell division protein FtsL
MTKVQLLMVLILIACALSVVTSQHRARKLFEELQQEKNRAQQMEIEWGQLQLEQSTWAMSARVEKIATQKLQMQLPKSAQIQFIHNQSDLHALPGGAIKQP